MPVYSQEVITKNVADMRGAGRSLRCVPWLWTRPGLGQTGGRGLMGGEAVPDRGHIDHSLCSYAPTKLFSGPFVDFPAGYLALPHSP